jgi:hypothetical protein
MPGGNLEALAMLALAQRHQPEEVKTEGVRDVKEVKNGATLSAVLPLQAAVVAGLRGPSSPAVVSSSSQEDDDEKKAIAMGALTDARLSISVPNGAGITAYDNNGVADFTNIIADPGAWLQKSEPYFTSNFAQVIDTKTMISNGVKPNDVLSGRGGETNHHPGNVAYRSLVKAFRPLYVQSTRRTKPKIAQCIVYCIRQAGGRFLKRVDTAQNGNEQEEAGSFSTGNSWVDIGNHKAREKTSQALREGAPDLRTAGGEVVSRSTSGTAHETSVSSVQTTPTPSSAGCLSNLSADPVRSSSTLPNAGYGGQQRSSSIATKSPSNHMQSASLGRQSSGSRPSSFTLHPLFHSLSPYDQQQIVLDELQAAREAVTSAELAAFRHYQYQQRHYENGRSFPPGYGLASGQRDVIRRAHAMKGNGLAQQPKEVSSAAVKQHGRMAESEWPRPVISHSCPSESYSEQSRLKRPAGSIASTDSEKARSSQSNDTAVPKIEGDSRGPRIKRLKLRMQQETVP